MMKLFWRKKKNTEGGQVVTPLVENKSVKEFEEYIKPFLPENYSSLKIETFDPLNWRKNYTIFRFAFNKKAYKVELLNGYLLYILEVYKVNGNWITKKFKVENMGETLGKTGEKFQEYFNILIEY